ncbi:MAG: hypothetical protein QOG31_1120 [Thermoplasmata archaeon]|jgi:hypothetical protein|nr:hypothetical protein [Thermoplasmata archaeon]
MTPNLPPTSTPRVFLHLGRRVAFLCSLALLLLAGQATAQLPALPAIAQGIDTPLGSTTAALRDGAIDACTQNAVSTAAVPALPALPVGLPVALPDAGIAAHACAHADLSQVAGAANALPVGQVAGEAMGQAGAVVEQAKAATGPLQAIIGWFMSFF